MIIKALGELIYILYGIRRIEKQKETFFFCRYRIMRVIFKKSGIFLGSIIIYSFTLNRILDRIIPFEKATKKANRQEMQEYSVILESLYYSKGPQR